MIDDKIKKHLGEINESYTEEAMAIARFSRMATTKEKLFELEQMIIKYINDNTKTKTPQMQKLLDLWTDSITKRSGYKEKEETTEE